MSENIESVLKEKISEFGLYLYSICENEHKKNEIHNQIANMKIETILLFLMFINEKKIDRDINDLVNKFELIDTE